jgi:hypothetical protein
MIAFCYILQVTKACAGEGRETIRKVDICAAIASSFRELRIRLRAIALMVAQEEGCVKR